MPVYLHKLAQMRLDECTHVSTTQLAEYMDIEPIVVRKDIALTGISGVRRVGYEVDFRTSGQILCGNECYGRGFPFGICLEGSGFETSHYVGSRDHRCVVGTNQPQIYDFLAL